MLKPIVIGVDRDGTINHDFHGHFCKHEYWRNEFSFEENAVGGLRKLVAMAEKRIFVATNQPGVAKGLFEVSRIREVNNYVQGELAKQGVLLEDWFFCPYVSREYASSRGISLDSEWVEKEDKGILSLRKPGIGMIVRAFPKYGLKMENCDFYFIGDHEFDVRAGLNANGTGCLVLTGHGQQEKQKVIDLHEKYPGRIIIAENLSDMADLIEQRRSAEIAGE